MKSNNPKGRPRKKTILSEADKKRLMSLIAADCSKEGLRMYLDLANDTFYKGLLNDPEIQKLFENGYELKRTMLKLKQMQVAMEGNVPMLIHLGKNYLDQTEKTQISGELNHDVKITKTDQQIIDEFLSKN